MKAASFLLGYEILLNTAYLRGLKVKHAILLLMSVKHVKSYNLLEDRMQHPVTCYKQVKFQLN